MGQNTLTETKRQLDLAVGALAEPGSGTRATLECRVADLQDRFLATPAASLDDVAIRLEAIRDLVAGLGDGGYLLHLVTATLNDVRALAAPRAQA